MNKLVNPAIVLDIHKVLLLRITFVYQTIRSEAKGSEFLVENLWLSGSIHSSSPE